MPSVPSPSALKAQLAATPRRIYALWHPKEDPARAVVRKFWRKRGVYSQDARQRRINWDNFDDTVQSGEFTQEPQPAQAAPGAVARLREALGTVDDLVVFYTDLLFSSDDAIGSVTASALPFGLGIGAPARREIRFWLGGVAMFDLGLVRIGECKMEEVDWLWLLGPAKTFTWKDPDGALDVEVGQSLIALLRFMDAPARDAPAAPAPIAPPEALFQRTWSLALKLLRN